MKTIKKEKLLDCFTRISIRICEVCGGVCSEKEFKDGDGACGKCWSI